MATTTFLKDKYYEHIKKALDDKTTQTRLLRYIMDYKDRNNEILTSPYMLHNMIFSTNDRDVIFKLMNIQMKDVQATIKEVPLPGKMTEPIANFTPIHSVLVMMMKYFIDMKEPHKLELISSYYAYSIYYSLFRKKFKKFDPPADVMKYTVNNMSNKFLLKRLGSVDKAIVYSVHTGTQFYAKQISELSDQDICDTISALKTRLNNMMTNVYVEFEKNYKQGNVIFEQIEQSEEGDFLNVSSKINKISALSDQYTTKFFMGQPDRSLVNLCAKMCEVSFSELHATLIALRNSARVQEVTDFYSSLFYIYFTMYPTDEIDDVKSVKFAVVLDKIFKKGNSIDKNIIRIKEVTNKWLMEGSSTYRTSTREATLNNFRKAIFLYFGMCVSQNG